jgi:vancomycin resistance protein VanW
LAEKQRKLFCDLNPTCYRISQEKEILKRRIKDLLSSEKFARKRSAEKLPNTVHEIHSNMVKRAPGVNLEHQLNKVVNIDLASRKIDGVIIRPGETFSLWKLVGRATKRKGYKEGRFINRNRLITGLGGGLCNLGNTIHLLALHSPLTVTEFHKHSDALAPDEGKRVPFSAGTSVAFNNIDFRFKNTTDQCVQICIWVEGEDLHAELRSETAYPHTYQLVEEDHHFAKEGEKFYRNSKIYREIKNRNTGDTQKELILDNHSEVLFDYDLIPKELIRQ